MHAISLIGLHTKQKQFTTLVCHFLVTSDVRHRTQLYLTANSKFHRSQF